MGNLLLVFVKWPEPGKVKTRLAQSVGDQEATRIYKLLVQQVIRILTPLFVPKAVESGMKEVTCWFFFTPRSRHEQTEHWIREEASYAGWMPEKVILKPQAGASLGMRLRAGFEQGFQAGFSKIAAIGTDCVELECSLIQEAWQKLSGDCDLVFGPARDGGYYLVAMNQVESCAIFDEIPWSSASTLTVSLARAEQAGYRVSLLEKLSDVDTIADWQRAKTMIDPGRQ